jgi:hypothetical protein
MGILNFRGKLSVAVVLQWRGETLPDPVDSSRADPFYLVANESVSEFHIKGSLGAATIGLDRVASKGKRFFDSALNAFTTSPVSGTLLDRFLDPAAAATFTIDLHFTYLRFFDAILAQMTSTAADLHNLGNPKDPKPILDTFEHSGTASAVKIKYKAAAQKLKALPCRLVDKEVKPRGAGKAPAVKLIFELDFLVGIDAVRREAMRKLIAMDWSKLARFGKAGSTEEFVLNWYQNVLNYLANYTDYARGERIRHAIVSRHLGKTSLQLATDLRNDIDAQIITANHWGQAREDMKTEHYQRLLSDLFGTLHQSAWLASPVAYLRDLPDDKGVQLTLQYGAGHCGEHAATSFSILTDIIKAPGSKVQFAIHTGNANIDHAFVVYDLDVDKVIHTITTAANNTATGGKDVAIDVWSLKDAIARNAPRIGYVMDPYLDKSVMKATARQLLEALNNKSRQAAKKDTDFLAFQDEFPHSFAVDDLSGKSEAERAALVKHV